MRTRTNRTEPHGGGGGGDRCAAAESAPQRRRKLPRRRVLVHAQAAGQRPGPYTRPLSSSTIASFVVIDSLTLPPLSVSHKMCVTSSRYVNECEPLLVEEEEAAEEEDATEEEDTEEEGVQKRERV